MTSGTVRVNVPDITCCVTVELKSLNGKRTVHKSADISIVRNEFRDMLLQVSILLNRFIQKSGLPFNSFDVTFGKMGSSSRFGTFGLSAVSLEKN